MTIKEMGTIPADTSETGDRRRWIALVVVCLAMLITARFLQGIGGALSSSVIVAIIVTEFPSPLERGKAMSAYVFVAVGGGSIGLLAGGVLTQFLSWHWIFFVND